MNWYNQPIEIEKKSTEILEKMQKCRFEIWTKNNAQEWSR